MPDYDYKTDIVPFLKRCWKNGLNKNLLDKYKSIFLEELKVNSVTKTMLSCPHCFLFGPNYQSGEDNGGVFVIGKETHGCGCKNIGYKYDRFETYKSTSQCPQCREELMMEAQTEYLFRNLEKGDKKFLKALQTIAGVKTGQEFLEANFIWDELIAVDYNGDSFKNAPGNDREEIKDRSKNKLTEELRLANPKYAIFLIGDYAGVLKKFLSLSWEQIKPIGNKLILSTAEKYPEKNVLRVVRDNQINEFCYKGIHCFSTSHPNRPNNWEYKEINGVKTKVIYWDDVIAKKVWDFLAKEIKR